MIILDHVLFAIIGFFVLTGCQMMRKDSSDLSEGTATPQNEAEAQTAQTEDNSSGDLKQAKIWARLDAIEQEQSRQKARIKLLEKGLLLGVVPDELRDPADLEHERRLKKKQQKPEPEKPAEPVAKKPEPEAAPKVVVEKSNDRAQFEKDISSAEELFRQGRYGRSVAAFEEVGNKFQDELTQGVHHYWIGLSWFNLKEYEPAQQHLQTLVSKYTASPWIPRAKLYLARIQIRRGLREQGLESLQKVIAEHGNEDAADMARADIETLKAKL